MAVTISGNASVVSGLFSSMSAVQTSRGNSFSTDILGINYSDYASIRTGSYHKLLSAYYSKAEKSDKSDKTDSKSNQSISLTKDSKKKLADIESKAEKFNDSAETLIAVGAKSVFSQKTTQDASGKLTREYDTDKIYQAVSAYADSYNALQDAASTSKVKQITNAAASMDNYTRQNEDLLASVGISIDGETNPLSIDREKFQNADMNTVKLLFNGTGSYAYQASVKASMIDYHAQNEASKSNTYGSTGSYSSTYSSGSIWNSYI